MSSSSIIIGGGAGGGGVDGAATTGFFLGRPRGLGAGGGIRTLFREALAASRRSGYTLVFSFVVFRRLVFRLIFYSRLVRLFRIKKKSK
jgi:hypothetical protein